MTNPLLAPIYCFKEISLEMIKAAPRAVPTVSLVFLLFYTYFPLDDFSCRFFLKNPGASQESFKALVAVLNADLTLLGIALHKLLESPKK